MSDSILIVDDEEDLREPIKTYLEFVGFSATAFATPAEALEHMSRHKVDVVITDIMLGEINGLELTRIIKKEFDADVIVITGYASTFSYEDAVGKGASDFIFKPVRMEEIHLRIKRVLRERRLTRERNEMISQLKTLAITDGLTKLYNSRYFYTQLQNEVERLNRYNHPLSLLLMDVDNFKCYNDTFGHIEGDNVLSRLGQVIQSCLRSMDTAYRYGGEEFTVLLPETASGEAFVVGERIREKMSLEKFEHGDGEPATITLSVGVTEYNPGEELTEFVKRADDAMYLSKEKGRNTISILNPGDT